MLLRPTFAFIPPALPSSAERPPIRGEWIHEIKHDGYRMMVRRDASRARLLTRNGKDRTLRFPTIVEAASGLNARLCLIDGEVVCCNENGLTVFALLGYRERPAEIFLYAFDLLELDGQDLRREPLETRKATLASLLRGCGPGLRLVEHLEHGGDVVYRHACRLGCEGIVSKRLGSPYVSGRTRHWLKSRTRRRRR
jgi:bifunctional non-homologous end joining protein LigD